MIQFHENTWTDRRTDRRTERPYFIGPFKLAPGVQKNYDVDLGTLDNKRFERPVCHRKQNKK